LLFATSAGYGKRVRVADFRVAHRGGVGVRTIPTGGRNGHVIGLAQVTDQSEALLIDTNGKIIRLSPQEIRTMGRQAKGVRLVRLDQEQTLASIVTFESTEDTDEQTPSLKTDQLEGVGQQQKIILDDVMEDDVDLAAEQLQQEIGVVEEPKIVKQPEKNKKAEQQKEIASNKKGSKK
jgi:hypothetical protein